MSTKTRHLKFLNRIQWEKVKKYGIYKHGLKKYFKFKFFILLFLCLKEEVGSV